MYKAAQARHVQNFLVNSFGGDSYGLAQVCADPVHYVGAWYLDPAGWGPVLLSLAMMQINGAGRAAQHGHRRLPGHAQHPVPEVQK